MRNPCLCSKANSQVNVAVFKTRFEQKTNEHTSEQETVEVRSILRKYGAHHFGESARPDDQYASLKMSRKQVAMI